MQFDECIRTRTSVRSYRPDPVPDNIMRRIIEAATRAPSSGNVQDWEFVIVKTPEGKAALASAAFDQGFISTAPAVVVICSDLEKITNAYGERGRALYSVQNTSAAAQNLMLAAWDNGIGTCWIGAFNEEAVKEALVLPADMRPLAMITMGYPASKPILSKRRPAGEVMHWETF